MKINITNGRVKNKNPLVSIIVLFHNGVDITLECLNAIKKCTDYSPLEVILVDNGSRFHENDKIKKYLSNFKNLSIKFIKNPKNLGFAKAGNLAARTAIGEILVFINNDVIVTQNWLEPLVSCILKDSRIVACQPKLRSFIQKSFFDYSGGCGGFIDIFGYPFTRGRVFNSIEKDVGQYDRSREILWASGSCLAIKAKIFLEIGGFDEYFFSYMEEIDLAIRLQEEGYKIYSVPKSLVYHYGAYTSNQNLPFKIYLNHRNHLYLVLKHYSVWPYFPIIWTCFLFELIAVFYYLFSLRFSFIWAVVKADFEIILKLPYFVKHGVIVWSGRSLLRLQNIYTGSVVFSHFVFGAKSFSQLISREPKRKNQFKRYIDVTFFDSR